MPLSATGATSNVAGIGNTAVGHAALFFNDGGTSNTAFGHGALYFNVGHANVAVGVSALESTNVLQRRGGTECAQTQPASSTSRWVRLQTPHADRDPPVLIRVVSEDATIIGLPPTGTAPSSWYPAASRPAATTPSTSLSTARAAGTVSSSRMVKDEIADMADASDVLMKLHPAAMFAERAGPVQWGSSRRKSRKLHLRGRPRRHYRDRVLPAPAADAE